MVEFTAFLVNNHKGLQKRWISNKFKRSQLGKRWSRSKAAKARSEDKNTPCRGLLSWISEDSLPDQACPKIRFFIRHFLLFSLPRPLRNKYALFYGVSSNSRYLIKRFIPTCETSFFLLKNWMQESQFVAWCMDKGWKVPGRCRELEKSQNRRHFFFCCPLE